MKYLKVDCTIHGRNEIKNLPKMVKAVQHQTYSFNRIIYVDDASTDGSAELAESYGLEVVELTRQHPSWLATPMLSIIVNKSVEKVYETKNLDYFMLMPCDVILERDYLEILLEKMRRNRKLVSCSGTLKGEWSFPWMPRGAGRMFRFSFWKQHVKCFPFSYTWETYPIYKAMMLGFETRAFKDAIMYPLRPTTQHKALYGYAMRELGYFPFYAFARCLLSASQNPKAGLNMLSKYVFSPYKPFDEELQHWIRMYQCRQLLKFLVNPREILREKVMKHVFKT